MTRFKIPHARRVFLDEHFFQWSFGKPAGFLPGREAFASISHPAELHYVAFTYNWDDGPDVLLWILNSPLCSRSTANLLFWRSLPSYFEESDFSDPLTCPEYCEPGFAVIRQVLLMYQSAQFSDMEIEFDPRAELEPVRRINPTWTVPEGVFDSISGVAVEVED